MTVVSLQDKQENSPLHVSPPILPFPIKLASEMGKQQAGTLAHLHRANSPLLSSLPFRAREDRRACSCSSCRLSVSRPHFSGVNFGRIPKGKRGQKGIKAAATSTVKDSVNFSDPPSVRLMLSALRARCMLWLTKQCYVLQISTLSKLEA